MQIEIRRIIQVNDIISGHLYIDGMYVCHTLENSKGALAPGTYPLRIRKCKQYKRNMAIVIEKPACKHCKELLDCTIHTSLPRHCPMLKRGNGVHNRTDGSIVLGKYVTLGCLAQSRQAFELVYGRIRKNVQRGKKVTIMVKSQGRFASHNF